MVHLALSTLPLQFILYFITSQEGKVTVGICQDSKGVT